jgi:hypothetical protein
VPRVKLGSQGFEVSAQGLGCMGMTRSYGHYDKPVGEMVELIREAVEVMGITFLETYGRRVRASHQRGSRGKGEFTMWVDSSCGDFFVARICVRAQFVFAGAN